MKILVTGGAGFIGSNLVDALIDKGHEVFILDNLSTGKKENLNSKANFVKADISDEKKVKKLFDKEKFDAVFHLAAQVDVGKSSADPVWDARQNIIGSVNILENAKNSGVKKIIFASTAAVYGDTPNIPTKEEEQKNPASPYGIGKLATEKYLDYYFNTFKLPYVALRYANVYGPRQNSKGEAGVVAIFSDLLLQGKTPVINGQGTQGRDYVYVGDIVQANLLALESGKTGIYNVSTSVETSVNDLAQMIKEKIGADVSFEYGPPRTAEQERSALDFSKAMSELSYQPQTKLAEGLQRTVDWFKKKYE